MSELQVQQLAELEALKAVFPEPGAVVFDHEAQPHSVTTSSPDTAPNQNLSGTVLLPYAKLAGRSTGLRFCLPALYPEEPPDLQVICEAGRTAHDALTDAVAKCLEENQGTEVLLLVIQAMEDLVPQLQSSEPNMEQKEENDHPASIPSKLLGRKAIWFHHIKSQTKRKHILNWAHELNVRGYSKPGFPGVIICEGTVDDVNEYCHKIRGMRWQAMSVRAEDSDDSHVVLPDKPRWHFQEPFQELGESDLDVLSVHCKAAQLDYLFKAVMKL